MTIKDDSLSNLLVKTWLLPEEFLPHPIFLADHRYECYDYLHKSLATLDIHDPSGKRLANVVRNILSEARGDASVVTKKHLRQIRNPAKKCGESFELVTFSLKITYYLIYERLEDTREFLDSLLKDDLVTLIEQLFSFVSEDWASTSERRVLSEDSSSEMIEYLLRI